MINYVNGDAITGKSQKPDCTCIYIAHLCNSRGLWGAGVSGIVGKRFPLSRYDYGKRIRCLGELSLGTNTYSNYFDKNPAIVVVNMIAQLDVNRYSTLPLVDYDKLRVCLVLLRDKILSDCEYDKKFRGKDANPELHMPKIGSGLAHGNWDIVNSIVREVFDNECGINVYIFDWTGKWK